MIDSERKDFVWRAVRISFYSFIGFYIIAIITAVLVWKFANDVALVIFPVSFWLTFLVLFFNFITSIVHLKKYKEKRFAITSLVISSLFLLSMLAFFLMGLLIGPFFPPIGPFYSPILID